jgi:ubiquinone/menaquinone biosynthesis C-methylase UbiE
MRLNPFETFIVNNFARDVLLRSTVAWLHGTARAPTTPRVLEIGCGQGTGVTEIIRRFRPQAIDAFDLDDAQVERAREKLARVAAAEGVEIRLWAGDAARIEAEGGRYDAVFEFTILHHVPEWRTALSEIHRVLAPGGLFLFEELSSEFFEDVPVMSALLRRFTDHPWSTMFDMKTFRRGITDAGFSVIAFEENIVPGWHRGVAMRGAAA